MHYVTPLLVHSVASYAASLATLPSATRDQSNRQTLSTSCGDLPCPPDKNRGSWVKLVIVAQSGEYHVVVIERVPDVVMGAYEDIIGPRGFCFDESLADFVLTTSGERVTLPVNVSCAPHVDIQKVRRMQPHIGIEFNYHAYS